MLGALNDVALARLSYLVAEVLSEGVDAEGVLASRYEMLLLYRVIVVADLTVERLYQIRKWFLTSNERLFNDLLFILLDLLLYLKVSIFNELLF